MTQQLLAAECIHLSDKCAQLFSSMDPLDQLAWLCDSSKDPIHRMFGRNIDPKSDSDLDMLKHARRVLRFEISHMKAWLKRHQK